MDSRVVAHPSTNTAWRSLTSLFGWEAVLSTQCGRIQRSLPHSSVRSECSTCPALMTVQRSPRNEYYILVFLSIFLIFLSLLLPWSQRLSLHSRPTSQRNTALVIYLGGVEGSEEVVGCFGSVVCVVRKAKERRERRKQDGECHRSRTGRGQPHGQAQPQQPQR